MDKLRRQSVLLPVKGGEIDEDAIELVVGEVHYWDYLSQRFFSSISSASCGT